MRNRLGKYAIGGIIGLIALIFAIEGFNGGRSLQGNSENAVAGIVNGDSIASRDFYRSLDQRVEFFKNMTGGKITDAQIQAFRIREAVFNDLVSRKLKAQAADSAGLRVSDDEVRDRIREMDYFKKDGKFDLATYRDVLAQNRFTDAGFENAMREDLAVAQWSDYFRARIRVSDEEGRQEFLTNHDKRNIRYVLLTPSEVGPSTIAEADAKKFAADPANLTAIQGRVGARKDTDYKGLTKEDAELRAARELLSEKKPEDARKAAEALADQVAGVLTADKGSDAKVAAILKGIKAEPKATGLIARSSRFIPGVGEAPELMNDAFAAKSPIDPRDGGKAKKYASASWVLVAVISDSEKPDLSKYDGEREKVFAQILMRKQRDLEEAWMKKLREKAKIEPNPDIVGSSAGGSEG